jgi:DNA repair exonuclease SbcCD ATPase subunit
MRTESAEIKVSADSKLAEGRRMVEDAQKKFTEAEAKLHSAESLQAEATRYQRTAERKLQEVEAREDDLRKHIISFKSEYVPCSFISYFVETHFCKLPVFNWGLVNFN